VGSVGWRGVFVLQAIAAAAFFPACVRWLKETPKADNVGFDLPGGVALMIASGSVLFLFDRAAEWGWGHPAVLVSGLIFPFAAYAFVRIEKRATDPLLPPKLLRTRAYAAPLSGELLAQLAANGAFFITPILLNQVFDLSVAQTAWMMVPLPLGMAVGSPVGGRLTVRIGERASGMIGASGIALAMALFLVSYLAEALPVVLAALLVMGLAHGFIRPSTASAAGAALEPEFFGVGMATMRMTSQLGGAAGISLAVTTEALGGFSATFATELVLALGAIAVMSLIISQTRPTTRAERRAAEDLVETENALTTMPAMEA
jgi:predicted MFS family arabinose efflux permease